VAVGSDADLILFDADEEQTISVNTHHMRVDYSMFEGTRVKGVTKTVLSRGRVIVENGKFVGKIGAGEFLKRENPARV
jgi:dihydropyrimidinase